MDNKFLSYLSTFNKMQERAQEVLQAQQHNVLNGCWDTFLSIKWENSSRASLQQNCGQSMNILMSRFFYSILCQKCGQD